METSIWTIERLRAGFEKFIAEQGRHPTEKEIDRSPHLPTVRTIQRRFGGLEQLRKDLGYTITHYGKGESRSKTAAIINKRGKEWELTIRQLLINKFGRMFVHIECPFSDSSKQRLDFYVYTPNGNFGVDVFFPQDLHSISDIVNIKERTYKNYRKLIYFIMANPLITQEAIDKLIANKTNRILDTHLVRTVSDFTLLINNIDRYTTIAITR